MTYAEFMESDYFKDAVSDIPWMKLFVLMAHEDHKEIGTILCDLIESAKQAAEDDNASLDALDVDDSLAESQAQDADEHNRSLDYEKR